VPEHVAAFSVLAGGAALWLGPALMGFRRLLPLGAGQSAVLCGLGLGALPLAKLAGLLKVATHHRPLGAVTFALMALGLVLGSTIVAARALAWARTRGGVAARWIGIVALLGPLTLLLELAIDSRTQAGLVDVTLGVGVTCALSLVPWSAALRGLLAKAGPILWGVLVSVAFASVFGDAIEPAGRACPTVAAAVAWVRP
jgi:hypothetical protein